MRFLRFRLHTPGRFWLHVDLVLLVNFGKVRLLPHLAVGVEDNVEDPLDVLVALVAELNRAPHVIDKVVDSELVVHRVPGASLVPMSAASVELRVSKECL